MPNKLKNHFKKWIALFIILAGSLESFGGSINGRVVNENRAGVKDAVIHYKRLGLETHSDAGGNFSFDVATVSGDKRRIYAESGEISALNGRLVIKSPENGVACEISLYSFSGRKIKTMAKTHLNQGIHTFAYSNLGNQSVTHTAGYILKVKLGFETLHVKIISGNTELIGNVNSGEPVLSRLAKGKGIPEDTLLISKPGCLRKTFTFKRNDTALGAIPLMSGFNSDSYPRVSGSTSAHPLGVIIACDILGTSYGWDDHADGTKRAVPFSSSNPGLASKIQTLIEHHGTHGSYERLIKGSADLILTARLPSGDELNYADSLGVKLETEPVAMDAFVFILHASNPVQTLTLQNIRDIYTGKIGTWSEVKGNDVAITPYQRNDNSGSQELMKSMVMKEFEVTRTESLILKGMMGPINRLPAEPSGIAYTVYFFNKFMAPRQKIKTCAIEGVEPNFQTIQSKVYPLWNYVYVVIRKSEPQTGRARAIRDWLLSHDGQQVVKKSGYVSIF